MKKQTFASIWDAIEATPEAAASMRVRAELMIEVQRYVEKSHLTQTEAAKRLGITQPRLNDLLRGRVNKFSVDALVNMLARAGRQVAVRVTKKAA
jgi:predicted XRE-type DNA-binding protein